MIFNYINSKKQKSSVIRFDQICLPGMTEDCRLCVFVHRDDSTPIKVVFVSDDSSQEQLNAFEESSSNILKEFTEKGVSQMIKESEDLMFVKISKYNTQTLTFLQFIIIDMKEVINTIICNATQEQYTCFNFPLNDHA